MEFWRRTRITTRRSFTNQHLIFRPPYPLQKSRQKGCPFSDSEPLRRKEPYQWYHVPRGPIKGSAVIAGRFSGGLPFTQHSASKEGCGGSWRSTASRLSSSLTLYEYHFHPDTNQLGVASETNLFQDSNRLQKNHHLGTQFGLKPNTPYRIYKCLVTPDFEIQF